MARTYVKEYDGYIVDTPNIDFVRCDGQVFNFDEVNTANTSVTNNNIAITGGWSPFPSAYVNTDKTMEVTYASSKFSMGIFAMANAIKLEEGDASTIETNRYEVEASNKITLPFEVQAKSVVIAGLKEASTAEGTPASGEFEVKITTSDTTGSSVITFNEGDVTVGETIMVSYKRRVINAAIMNVKTNSTTAKGTLYAHYPVYSAGDDCADAAIKGWVHMCIFRVRATALPGFDSSYKQAGTNSVTFSAMDPKRADHRLYNMIYEPADENGDMVVTSQAESVDWM